jgi:hypothetical protein
LYDGKDVGCLVLDVRMPGTNGMEFLGRNEAPRNPRMRRQPVFQPDPLSVAFAKFAIVTA